MLQRPKSSKPHGLSPKEKRLYAAQDPSQGPIMLVRFFDWEARFSRFIKETIREGIKCDWVFHSCASWSAMGAQEITGYNFYEPFEEMPIESPGDAYLAIKRLGFDSLDHYIETLCVEKPLVLTNRADFVLVPSPEYADMGMPNALGLAEPPFVWVLRADGLGRANLGECTRAFAIGSLG